MKKQVKNLVNQAKEQTKMEKQPKNNKPEKSGIALMLIPGIKQVSGVNMEHQEQAENRNTARNNALEGVMDYVTDYLAEKCVDKCYIRGGKLDVFYKTPAKLTGKNDNPSEFVELMVKLVTVNHFDNEKAFKQACISLGITEITAWDVIRQHETHYGALTSILSDLELRMCKIAPRYTECRTELKDILLTLARGEVYDWESTPIGAQREVLTAANTAIRRANTLYCNGGDAGAKIMYRAWCSAKYVVLH